MRWDVFAWAAFALVLFAAEAILPGAFMLWLGFAAAAVFLAVFLLPVEVPVLAQVAAFVVLSFASIQVYRRWFRGGDRATDKPLLNRRAEQLVGTVATLDQPIEGGRGRVRIDDAFWTVEGADLPLGTRVRVIAVNGMTLKVQEA